MLSSVRELTPKCSFATSVTNVLGFFSCAFWGMALGYYKLNRIFCMETQVFEIVCGGIIALISTAAFTHPALSKA